MSSSPVFTWSGPACGSLLVLAAAFVAGPAASQQAPSGHVSAQLVSEYSTLAAGQTAIVGLRLAHEPQWHTYWTVPGDAGLPTRLKWQLPPGFKAGAVQWPVPQLLRVGSLANYGYEGTVLLPVAITVPATASPGGKARLAAHADWLVCKDVCIPESADLTLELPVGAAAPSSPTQYEGEFAAASARIPGAVALNRASAVVDGDRIRVSFVPDRPLDRLEFFPLEAMRVQAAAPQRLNVKGSEATLDLQAAQPIAADFKVLRGVLVGNGGPGQTDAAGPGWAGTVELPLKAGV
ncbi:MAG TPA: protein-disulfide reductase DsbD domain-containing protein, partial [Burkholderiaceae bacterium]|nr:protein-disulfide reductase DsbD domain-containing protein [Burkholderiaceae bacterium]